MAQRTTTAEKPAQTRHLGRMGCLTIIGVILLVVVGTVFAPDIAAPVASPSASPTVSATLPVSAAESVASTPEVLPDASLPAESLLLGTSEITPGPTWTRALPLASATPEREPATQVATSAPVHTAAPSPTLTRTSPPTPTPTVALILATNTHPPLVIITNTPSTSGG